MKRAFPVLIITLLSVFLSSITGVSSKTDIVQTIPAIVVSSPNAIAGCTVLNMYPGAAVVGRSAFILANCPNGIPAISLSGVETPNFALSTGWARVVLMFSGYPCSWRFIDPQGGNTDINATTTITVPRLVGMNMTSLQPIAFTKAGNSTSQLMEGGYNYCLYYQNPPSNGLQSFTITWTG